MLRETGGSMKRAAILLSLIVAGCGVSGHYRSEGPCKGFHKDQNACERAHANSQAMPKVKLGQSTEQVQAIMGAGFDRREATADCETWSYLTNYMGRVTTTIIFRKGVVTDIRTDGGRC
jgi:hypothetical protein